MNIPIDWECATAYDMFVSLLVLNQPAQFGLRGSWAAGVRSRLPLEDRKVLEESQFFLIPPLHWLYSLPGKKDGAGVLDALEKIPAGERLKTLALAPRIHPKYAQTLLEVTETTIWTQTELRALTEVHRFQRQANPMAAARQTLEWWSRPEEFGDCFFRALTSYYQAFFQEEEERILPALREALEAAKEKAKKQDVESLLEDLSQGVRFPFEPELKGLVLAPSYWSTPLIVYDWISTDRQMVVFGARPADIPLVPGEMVPDALLRSLKALADPTRLKIMKILSQEALTPSQLARHLRLRPPTVVHHLNELRLAGLVQMTLVVEGERRYAARSEMVSQTFEAMEKFLRG